MVVPCCYKMLRPCLIDMDLIAGLSRAFMAIYFINLLDLIAMPYGQMFFDLIAPPYSTKCIMLG